MPANRMTCEEYLTRLNLQFTEQQQAAIASVDDPTLLLAVPGSGKTTVLVARLGYLIHGCGVPPEQILTVTYTVAATRDMRRRFATAFGDELADRLEFRTINGICARILYFFERQTGKELFQLVSDEKMKLQLLTGICQQRTGEYPADSDLKNISTQITYIKNMMLEEDEIQQLGEETDLPLADIYRDYTRTMRERRQMDYDDQMVYALNMLRRFPWLLDHFQGMYTHICVDEAQDTSKIQHTILALLAGKTRHLFMVGDEDQSIYGFRAAYPEALLNFEKDHPGARVLLMEQNFRSDAQIVAAADRFIRKNQLRHPKTMAAARRNGSAGQPTVQKLPGAAVRQIDLKHRNAQYTWLVKMAADCTTEYAAARTGTAEYAAAQTGTAAYAAAQTGTAAYAAAPAGTASRKAPASRPSETAILYRDNESILPVVDRLEREGIPCRIRKDDLSFFNHRLVQDIRNIIAFSENPADSDLFMKIYFKIGTYMSKAAAMEACRDSARRGIPVLDAALRYGHLSQGTRRAIPELQDHLQELSHLSASDALNSILREMGYGAYMERAHLSDNKLQILRALASREPSPARLTERLDELAHSIADRENDPACPLILSTIHSSKGLEYDTVYLLDIHDGIFPENVVADRSRASKAEIAAYEEERRIFYVGATRAKNSLNILTVNNGSTFCRELLGVAAPEEVSGRTGAGSHSSSGSRRAERQDHQRRSREGYRLAVDDINEAYDPSFDSDTSAGGYGFSGRYTSFDGPGSSARYTSFDGPGSSARYTSFDGSGSSGRSRNSYAASLSRRKKEDTRPVTESEYYEKMEEIQNSGNVHHRLWGDGRLVEMQGDAMTVEFSGKTKKCRLRYLMEHDMV